MCFHTFWDCFGTAMTELSSHVHVCMRAKSLQSYPALCDPMDCSLPGSSVHRILQARILEWAVVPSSRGSSRIMDQPHVCYVFLRWHVGSLPLAPPGKPVQSWQSLNIYFAWRCLVVQSCPTLCNPMWILQARILEWVARPSSRGSSWPKNQTRVSCLADRFFTSWATREAPSGLYQKGVQSSDQYPKDSHLSPTLTHVPIQQKLHKLSHARHYPWLSERLETNKIGGPTFKGFHWFFIVK